MKACSTTRRMIRGAAGSVTKARTASVTALPRPSKKAVSCFMSARGQRRVSGFPGKIECERSPAASRTAAPAEQAAEQGGARGARGPLDFEQRSEMKFGVPGRTLPGDEIEKKILAHRVRSAPVVAINGEKRTVGEADGLVAGKKRFEGAEHFHLATAGAGPDGEKRPQAGAAGGGEVGTVGATLLDRPV